VAGPELPLHREMRAIFRLSPPRATNFGAMNASAALDELAASYGVYTQYRDSFGHEHQASAEALVAVLSCLGASVQRLEDATSALAERRARQAAQVLAPFTVFWEGQPQRLFVGGLPQSNDRFALELQHEAGQIQRFEGRFDELEWGQGEEGRGHGAWIDLERLGAWAGGSSLGQHQVRLSSAAIGADPLSGSVLVAPERAWVPEQPRQWGVFVPTYALRGRGLGVADVSDLHELVGWVGARRGHMIGTLPLLAQFLDELYEPSPYSPVSRLFWNEFYLDVQALPEWGECARARERAAEPGVQAEVARLSSANRVDYRHAAALKRQVLELLAATFYAGNGPRSSEFLEFTKSGSALRYAQFRAVVERERTRFEQWPERLQRGQVQPTDYDESACRYHLYCQFRMAQQMRRLGGSARELGLGLYLDLPVGVHSAGYDLWAERDAFLLGCCAGAPPDVVFRGGQNWGLAPLSPEGLRAQSYRYFRDVIRHHLGCAGALRIDHVMGMQRIFCIPYGMDARSGVYVGYRPEEFFAVLTLESVRHRAELIGEDLGTVPPGLPESLARHQIRRMHVVECAIDGGTLYWGSLTPSAVASVNTHDIMPFAAWFFARDIAQRVAGGQDAEAARSEAERRATVIAQLAWQLVEEGYLPKDLAEPVGARARAALTEAPNFEAIGGLEAAASEPEIAALFGALLEKLGKSAAPLVVVNLEDTWLETRPQNTPGTDSSCANWENKARLSVKSLEPGTWPVEVLTRLAQAREADAVSA
jgi:4-alpha-glucanotransferase